MDFLEALAVPCIRAKVCLASLKTSEGSPGSKMSSSQNICKMKESNFRSLHA